MELTIALNRYDRHAPFFNGTVTPPDGFSFRPFEVGESTPMRDGDNRHGRMMNGLEFDVCEMSLSSFVIAVARDPDLALVGVPAFPRRLFSLGQMYVNADAGIDGPKDLIGRNVGLHSFQTTLSVLAKGDLKLDYGVAWEEAKQMAYRYYDDTAYSLLAWGRTAFEGERNSLGADPWPTGFSADRENLEQFIAYQADQGLIDEAFPAERLFHPSVLDG